MKHHLISAIDWLSIKLNALAILFTLINPDPFIKALTVLASCVTIGYNSYRWYHEVQKNRKSKSE